jgi:hypothetical protein
VQFARQKKLSNQLQLRLSGMRAHSPLYSL